MVSGRSSGGKEREWFQEGHQEGKRESGFRKVIRRERERVVSGRSSGGKEREWFQGRQEGKRERVVSGSLGGKERESGFRVVRREREREWFQGR